MHAALAVLGSDRFQRYERMGDPACQQALAAVRPEALPVGVRPPIFDPY
jgi:hypothetical protein